MRLDPGSRKETERPQAWDAAPKNQSIGLDEAKNTALPQFSRSMQYAGSPHPGLEFKWQVEKGVWEGDDDDDDRLGSRAYKLNNEKEKREEKKGSVRHWAKLCVKRRERGVEGEGRETGHRNAVRVRDPVGKLSWPGLAIEAGLAMGAANYGFWI